MPVTDLMFLFTELQTCRRERCKNNGFRSEVIWMGEETPFLKRGAQRRTMAARIYYSVFSPKVTDILYLYILDLIIWYLLQFPILRLFCCSVKIEFTVAFNQDLLFILKYCDNNNKVNLIQWQYWDVVVFGIAGLSVFMIFIKCSFSATQFLMNGLTIGLT